MFKNFLAFSLRIIERNKLITLINVFGLSTGIAFCMLIFLFVKEEYSFDRFHQHAHRIYRLELTNTHALEKAQREKKELPKPASGQFTNIYISLPLPLGEALEKQLPEVEASVRLNGLNTAVISNGKHSFKETIHYTDANFFKVFSFQLLHGQKQTALSQLSHIVITKKMALKYFGRENPIGKTLHLSQEYIQKSFVVSAVAEDVPEN